MGKPDNMYMYEPVGLGWKQTFPVQKQKYDLVPTRAGWPKRLALVWATLCAEVDFIGVRLC